MIQTTVDLALELARLITRHEPPTVCTHCRQLVPGLAALSFKCDHKSNPIALEAIRINDRYCPSCDQCYREHPTVTPEDEDLTPMCELCGKFAAEGSIDDSDPSVGYYSVLEVCGHCTGRSTRYN